MVERLLEQRLVPHLKGYTSIRREVKYGAVGC